MRDTKHNHTPPSRTPPPNDSEASTVTITEATRVAFQWGSADAIEDAAKAFNILMEKPFTQGFGAPLFAMLVEIRDLGIMKEAGDTTKLKALIADFEHLAKTERSR
ncbi:hypothetical protein [Vreelandella neptunia]|uniref:Uncharacterized protein n=1 Tax=Vreelandella neptunia TaxID=115551 RepID=A0ABZ0YIB7_9GAMM|nr:hypothetical protein [Halomonas neptunia]MDN3562144.1 hypothetical protein [Halomonas neptunia]WQH11845.1 hypothetical protein SR894_17040 [Halomonas neptunia]